MNLEIVHTDEMDGAEAEAFDAFCKIEGYALDDPDGLRAWGEFREERESGIDPDAAYDYEWETD